MATPRKHWFRVADSVLHEDWTNDQVAGLIRLMAYLNTRWARNGLGPDDASRAVIPLSDLCQITGKKRGDYAKLALGYLVDSTGIAATYGDTSVEIFWPKWSEFQGLRTRESPPPQDAPARRKKERPRTPPAPSVCRSCGCEHPSKKHRIPEKLSDDQRTALLRWAKDKGHSTVVLSQAVQTVREWADAKGATNLCWVRAIQGYIRDGWALRGTPGSTGNGPRSPQPARPTPLAYGSREWCAAQTPPIDYDEMTKHPNEEAR